MIIIEEMIISGILSKIVSDVIDIPENLIKDAIRNADKKRKEKNQSIETRIYQVTIDAIKEFTKREYKEQGVLYDAAESIILGFKNDNNNVEAVRAGLKMLGLQVTSETCKDFLKTLQHEICMDENDILYKEIILNQGGQIFEAVREGFDVSNKNDEETHKKLDYAIESIDSINKKFNGTENGKAKHYEIPIKNRAGEYADKWDENVFLNNFNKRDKNAGVNIKLKELYSEKHLPHYVWEMADGPLDDLKETLREYTVDNNDKKMLLILGQAGIGKSTLITWIMANLVEEKENILVYQFASDLKSVNWQDDNILDEIFATIDLGYNMLEGKILILDGFDEIFVKENRERILHKLNQELERKNYLRKFSLIVTCRENYVDKETLKGIEYITLQAWDETQIRSFCETYEEVIMNKDSARINKNSEMEINKIIEKKDIMGIPLILYMVLALEVDVERSSSTVDIYDQIFSLKRGGIYDRGYDVEHRINDPETKKHIHHISQRIAFWMFENNADKATISQEKFEEICEREMKELEKKGEDIKGDTMIGNFFQLKHCEGKGTSELQFVHRSIYEYFVVIYFFESIHKLKSKEEIAGKLGELLKGGHLSEQILEFIKCKFDCMKGVNLPDIIKDIFNIMLQDGMTYHVKGKYKNIAEKEMNIFLNMINIICLWNFVLGELNNKIVFYLQHNNQVNLNLAGIKLSRTNLSGANLNGANLSETFLSRSFLVMANLSGANLKGANLSNAFIMLANLSMANLTDANLKKSYLRITNLSRANLSGANLSGADLTNADLRKANLSNAILTGVNLDRADLRGAYLANADLREVNLSKVILTDANLDGADLSESIFNENQVNILYNKYDLRKSKVLLSEMDEIIDYQEYCLKI